MAAVDINALVRYGDKVQSNPRVSVIIPVWLSGSGLAADWLDEALESVRAQTFKDWEVIVIDDGSPVSVEPKRTDDIVLVRQANTGPGGARNRGAEYARGEFIAYLDADDHWRPEKLAKQISYLDANPEVVLVCTDISTIDCDSSRIAKTVREKGAAIGDRIPFERVFYENCIVCSTVIVRRAVLSMTHGMDVHRRMGEEFGLWLRIGMLGPVGYIEEPLCVHRRHGSSLMSGQLSDGSWLTREREVYEEFLTDHPQLRSWPMVRKAMARMAFEGGWYRMARGEWQQACRCLLIAVGKNPLLFKAWVQLALACLHIGPQHRFAWMRSRPR